MDKAQEGNFWDVADYKIGQARDDLDSAELLFEAGKYKATNNRAYYSCFHAISSILALEPIAFKRHKDTLYYFNKNYVHTEIFPKDLGRKIAKLEVIRHKSDYDDFYIASKEDAAQQIHTAREMETIAEKYLQEKRLSAETS